MGTFTADLSAFCKKEAPAILDNTVRGIVMEIHNRLDYRSPVGDPKYWANPEMAPDGYAGGTFRRNWQYGYGSPPTSFIVEADPAGAIARAEIMAGVLSNKGAGMHYLTNNSPYSQALEDGHSWNQAPYGIVTLVELEFPQIVAMAKA